MNTKADSAELLCSESFFETATFQLYNTSQPSLYSCAYLNRLLCPAQPLCLSSLHAIFVVENNYTIGIAETENKRPIH